MIRVVVISRLDHLLRKHRLTGRVQHLWHRTGRVDQRCGRNLATELDDLRREHRSLRVRLKVPSVQEFIADPLEFFVFQLVVVKAVQGVDPLALCLGCDSVTAAWGEKSHCGVCVGQPDQAW